MQPVRFKSAGFTWKKAVSLAVYVTLPYIAWTYINQYIDIHIEEIETEDDKRKPGEWETQEGEEEVERVCQDRER
jgi:hypothetical protein